MGGDGGVLPTGRKFIRGCGKSVEDKKEDGKNITKAQVMRTTICAQCSEPLTEPVVACEMGNLYNKEAILSAFINKTLNPLYAHVRGMKDIKTLKFTPNPAYSIQNESNGESRPKYVCPLTSMEFNGIHPFIVIWTTGFVIAEKAIREIGIDGLQQDYGPFTSDDIVHLIPNEDDIKDQKEDMDLRREIAQNLKNEKKDSKKSKRSLDITSSTHGVVDSAVTSSEDNTNKKIRGENDAKKIKNSNNNGDKCSDKSKNFGAITAIGSAVSLTSATSVARKAKETVENQEEKSKVFKDLFHKGKEADKYDRDLFMSVAGLRYSLR